jgi:hypothetical protein
MQTISINANEGRQCLGTKLDGTPAENKYFSPNVEKCRQLLLSQKRKTNEVDVHQG